MATTLKKAAQMAEALYYQDYRSRTDFFTSVHFRFMIAEQYSAMLNAAYQAERQNNKRDSGFSNIELSSAWLLIERPTIQLDEETQEFYADTKYPVFSFDWDSSANALQGVHSVGKNRHIVYRKISLMERRFRQILPTISKVLFYLKTNKRIVFWGTCEKKEIEVQYVPVVVGNDDNCVLSDNIVSDVIKMVVGIMLQAKQGSIIQEANDGNKNEVLGQQVNPALTKTQQQA